MAEDCVHHWFLDRSADGVTAGACLFCGAERSFQEPEYSPFHYTPYAVNDDWKIRMAQARELAGITRQTFSRRRAIQR